MLKTGDDILIKAPHWHEGTDIGGRIGQVKSLTGYVLVHVYNYERNPVKCFRSEVRRVIYDDEENQFQCTEEDLEELASDLLDLRT